jgi:hypothetical protein
MHFLFSIGVKMRDVRMQGYLLHKIFNAFEEMSTNLFTYMQHPFRRYFLPSFRCGTGYTITVAGIIADKEGLTTTDQLQTPNCQDKINKRQVYFDDPGRYAM